MKGSDYNLVEGSLIRQLETKLPKHLFFHNISRTKDLIRTIDMIARWEGASEEENLLLRLGALYQNSGFLKTYKNSILASISIAKEHLNYFAYPNYQIEIVVNLLKRESPKGDPNNRLLKIFNDADSYYFGADDYFLKSELLRLELEAQLKIEKQRSVPVPLRKWNEALLVKLDKHRYYTRMANELVKTGKEKNIQQLKELLGIKNVQEISPKK